jgi:1,4-dihydroxy-2-naphthoate octaprenyltransferase
MFTNVLRLLRPFQLVTAALTYALGIGIAHYLGKGSGPATTLVGAALVFFALSASNLLMAYFAPFVEPVLPDDTPRQRAELRPILMVISAGLLTVAAFMVILLGWQGALTVDVTVLLVALTVLCVAVGVPPIRLMGRGYGEVALALNLAGIVPALAFTLQGVPFNRLVSAVTFPLFMIGLASFLALDFPSFAEDVKYERRTLLTRLGWQRAIPLHNALLASAYLLLASAPSFGFPFKLFWPALLTIPLASYQIFMLHNIGAGTPPLWRALTINAAAIFGLTAYLLTLTFWLR